MKILAISYLFPNRVHKNLGIFVLNRLSALKKLGLEIVVINPIAWSPIHSQISRYAPLKDVPEQDEINGLTVYHPRFFSIPRYFKGIEARSYYKAVAPLVKQIKKDFDFDIIDLHWTYPDLPAGTRLAEEYQKPLLVTLRGVEAFYLDSSDKPKDIIEEHIKKVDGTVALSNELKSIGDSQRQTNHNSFVVRNGVDTDSFYYEDRDQCRAQLGIQTKEPIILSVGSLIYRKGFDLVIKSLKEIVKTPGLEKTQYYIVGSEGPEGDYRKELYEFVEQAELQNNVVFQGAVDNNLLRAWYNAADVFCLASRGEGSPNVLTEALACGCPAVATDVGSVKEILDSEEGIGICVPSDDAEAIGTSLIQLLQNDINRKENEIKFGKYTWEWCAGNVIDVYKTVLEQTDKS